MHGLIACVIAALLGVSLANALWGSNAAAVSFLLLASFVSTFLIPGLWLRVGGMLRRGWRSGAPVAQAAGRGAAAGAARIGGNAWAGFMARPSFWLGTIAAIITVILLIASVMDENLSLFYVALIFLAASIICFVTHNNWWGDVGTAAGGAITWGFEMIFKYFLYVITALFVVMFICSHYFDWSAGSKWIWGILAFVFTWASVVTARGKWDEFWKITFGGPRPILVSTGVCFFFIGFFVKAFVPGGLGELLATLGVCLVLIGTVGVAMWNKKSS